MDYVPENELVHVPLGGVGEIGMNLSLYGMQGQWLIMDVGVTFADDSLPGVDLLMPDIQFIEHHKDKLAGIVITHAHEDHIGAVAMLWPLLKCPVYASPFAAAFLEHKLKEEDLQHKVPVTIVELGSRFQVGGFDVEFISTTHSIPEPNAVALHTPYGTLLHTGDWKLDTQPLISETADVKRLTALGDAGVLAILGDSTGAMTPGRSGSEGDVRTGLVQVFQGCKRRIVVTCFASNIARLESIAYAAEQVGRRICLVGRSLHRMLDTAQKTGYLQDFPALINDEDFGYIPAEDMVLVVTGSQGEERAALSRIAFGQHRYVFLEEDDTVVFSSRVIPGNEKAVYRIQNQLVRRGVHIISNRDAYIHVSGHPNRDEIRDMFAYVRPDIAVPVHGELMHLHEHALLAADCGVKTPIITENGHILRLAPGAPRFLGQVPTGRLAKEPAGLVPVNSDVIRDRKKLMFNGCVLCTVVVDQCGDLEVSPMITTHGVYDKSDPDMYRQDLLDLHDAIVEALDTLDPDEAENTVEVREVVRVALRRTVRKHLGRRPSVDVHVVRV
jgi:ribonuclease J